MGGASKVVMLMMAAAVAAVAALACAAPASAVQLGYAPAGVWPGVTWHLERPQGVALDAMGNAYVADTYNDRIVKFDVAGRYVTSWGGTGLENGKFNRPWDVACDPSGTTVFVSDTMNHRVQQFVVVGTTATFVRKWGKEGGPDFTGSNPGEFNEPRGIVMDALGDLYVVDTRNYRVQKFEASSVGVSFLAEWGHAGSGVDRFLEPWAIDVAPNGWVYVLDRDETNCYVRAFTSEGVPVEFTTGGNGWGAPTITKNPGYFAQPEGIAVDDDGYVYVSDNKSTSAWVQKFSAEGEFVTGWGRIRQYGDVDIDGRPVFLTPGGMDAMGAADKVRLVVADGDNDRCREFDGVGDPLRVRDAYGVLGSHGDAWWRFDQPYGVAAGASGTVYVADRMNHRVQRFGSRGEFDRITPTNVYTIPRVDNGYFAEPAAVAFDPVNQFVYVAEVGNDRIQRLTADLQYEEHKWGAYGTALGAFKDPQGVATGPAPDGGRWVYVADTGNNRIQVFTAEGVPTVQFGAGTLSGPTGIVVDSDGTVYVSDTGHKRVVKFVHSGDAWLSWSVASVIGATGSGDALLVKPWGIAMDTNGSLYVSDTDAGKVKKYAKSSGVFEEAFGAPGSAAGQLQSPRGVAVTAAGVVYVADATNDRYQAFVDPLEVVVSTPTDRGCYNSAVMPSISFDAAAVTYGVDLDGAPWDGRAIALEGVHVLRAWATDQHGLTHEKTVEFTIDYRAPVTVATVLPRYSNQAIIHLSASDALSGVQATRWSLDSGPEQAGTLVVTGAHGLHQLAYWSVDRAGNVEREHLVNFRVDDTMPPTTAIDNKTDYVDSATLTLRPSDPTGPCETVYKLDGASAVVGTSVSTSVIGRHVVEFSSTDRVGNQEATKTATFTVRQSTRVAVTRSASTVGYGGSVTIGATLKAPSGTLMKGRTMLLSKSYDGATWKSAGTFTSSTGSYSYSTKVYRKTFFKWQFAGEDLLLPSAATTSVLSKAKLTEPVAPSSAYRNRTVAMSGYLKPRHTAGTRVVELRGYRYESGKWVRRVTASAIIVDYDTYSKYRGSLVFKSRGKWRVRAYHNDDDHAATYSTYDYLTVK